MADLTFTFKKRHLLIPQGEKTNLFSYLRSASSNYNELLSFFHYFHRKAYHSSIIIVGYVLLFNRAINLWLYFSVTDTEPISR